MEPGGLGFPSGEHADTCPVSRLGKICARRIAEAKPTGSERRRRLIDLLYLDGLLQIRSVRLLSR